MLQRQFVTAGARPCTALGAALLLERKDSRSCYDRKMTEKKCPMGTRRSNPGALDTARKHEAIRQVQAAIARELARQSEPPKTLPRRIADLVRELHRRLRKQS